MADFTPEQERELEAWIDQQAAARGQLTDNVVDFAERAILQLFEGGGFYDDDRVDEVGADVAAVVRAAQEDLAQLTSLYLDEVFEVMDADPPEVEIDLPERLRLVDPVDEWRRPAVQYRYAISQDQPQEVALDRAVARARSLAGTDAQLAHRESVRQVLAASEKVRGYRRIIRPEQSESKQSCGICVAAADQFYSSGDLLAIHDRCNCEVLPVITGKPDPKNIGDLYRQVAELSDGLGYNELSRVRVAIRENGEIGPVLTDADQSFRGPDDVESAA